MLAADSSSSPRKQWSKLNVGMRPCANSLVSAVLRLWGLQQHAHARSAYTTSGRAKDNIDALGIPGAWGDLGRTLPQACGPSLRSPRCSCRRCLGLVSRAHHRLRLHLLDLLDLARLAAQHACASRHRSHQCLCHCRGRPPARRMDLRGDQGSLPLPAKRLARLDPHVEFVSASNVPQL